MIPIITGVCLFVGMIALQARLPHAEGTGWFTWSMFGLAVGLILNGIVGIAG